MFTTPLAVSLVIAYHGTEGGGEAGSSIVLWVFLGLVATAAWLLFSKFRWRHTVMVAVAGWLAGLVLAFGF